MVVAEILDVGFISHVYFLLVEEGLNLMFKYSNAYNEPKL